MSYESKVGNVCALKSGGPAMTVIDETLRSLTCAWFDSLGVYHEATFSQNAVH